MSSLPANNDELTFEIQQAAFHRGIDAAKEAIRSEQCEHEFCKAVFINAIARKCGIDLLPRAGNEEAVRQRTQGSWPETLANSLQP